MAFIDIQEMKTVAYAYQIEEITEADDDIVLQAISAGIDHAKSYLRPGNKKEWLDGRLLYDVNATFSATGSQRNILLMEMTKSLALWYLCRLCNVDMIYENVKDRYDRSITWLKQVNKGEVTLDLPLLPDTPTTVDPAKLPFRFGSRAKFNHE